MKFNQVLEITLATLAILALVCILLGAPVMLLWNWVLPSLLGVSKITFFQAVGLNILCSLLFKTNVNIKRKE